MIADLSDAACSGVEPAFFDSNRFPEARLALWFCRKCTIVEDCMATVRPSKSYFDGVAANVVWRNGYRVRLDNTTREDRLLRRRADAT